MAEELTDRIVEHLKKPTYRPQRPRKLARELHQHDEQSYHSFRDALRELMREGRVVIGAGGNVVLPAARQASNRIIGVYRHNRRGFGFVVPDDPSGHEDLYIPEGENGGAITGDVVAARVTSRGRKDGRTIYTGRVIEVIERTNRRFVGSLQKVSGEWLVYPDGNAMTQAILAPDAASRHIRPGTKVVIELTTYPEGDQRPQGVITEVLGQAGEKDVDLRSVIVQYNLPGEFSEDVLNDARNAVASFKPEQERENRLDLTDQVICTIDPDDAKDFDDAISLRELEDGQWELGVHIADVSFFVREDSPLGEEAAKRGNSSYFPGFVIPMLPEILSNGVCSLQEGVPRLTKSAFITLDENARPVATRFANSIIRSRKRLRYREAQAILDNAQEIPHPEGPRRLRDYPQEVVGLLHDMNALARRIQRRRLHDGQLVLNLPEVELVLDEDGKVKDAVPEDTSFTHTLIEMFMVEANEAVARLLDGLGLPFLRRIHPEPDVDGSERLRQFVHVAGYKLPKILDRHAIQQLLTMVKGKPESFAINLAVLKSLTRAEYSPETIGHFALASEHYCHFTSPIRRYADLTVHRLLDAYFDATRSVTGAKSKSARKRVRIDPEEIPSYDELVTVGKHISFTERRSEDAERELRKVKILTLMQQHLGEEFQGVITGVTNFGLFVQISQYLVDGLIRYEMLMDDWWQVDERSGSVRGQRSGIRFRIGDVVKVKIAKVDLARRELDLGLSEIPRQPKKNGNDQPFVKERKKTPHRREKNRTKRGGNPFSRNKSKRR